MRRSGTRNGPAWAVLLLLSGALAQTNPVEPARRPVAFADAVQDKNFYLLSMLDRTPALRDAVRSDPVLARLGSDRLTQLDQAAASCKSDTACYASALQWSEPAAADAGRALSRLYAASPAVRAFADGPLRASGLYVRYHEAPAGEVLDRAWQDCVRGMNQMIDVYGTGAAPRYPAIDSMAYDAKSDRWRTVVGDLVAVLRDDRASLDLFFKPSMRFALELMFLNDRDEAGRLEPMESGENAPALRRIASTDWSRYAYSVIVVPGSGNDRPGVRLSPAGKLRDELAALRYRQGKAPFLIVSGGYVHPDRTEFCEAVEMKRDLMARFGIPAAAILIEPHARHTTTNLRNAARLMYRYGVPFEKKALVTTDRSQSASIEAPAFAGRCREELGYVPIQVLGRTSLFDLEFIPRLDSLHAGPLDPLDP